MKLTVGQTGVSTERPTGVVLAVLSRIDDAGTHPNPYRGNAPTNKLVITWQLAQTYTTNEGKCLRYQQTELVTASLAEKARLRGLIEGMLGQTLGAGELDLDKLIGRSCMLTLVKDEKGYTKITACAPLMVGVAPLAVLPMPKPAWIDTFSTGAPAPVDPSTSLHINSVLVKPVDPSTTPALPAGWLDAALAKSVPVKPAVVSVPVTPAQTGAIDPAALTEFLDRRGGV